MIKKHFLLFVLFFSLISGKGWEGTSFGQNITLDSLLTLLKSDKPDTNKVKHLCELSLEYRNIGLYDTAIYFANNALSIAKQLNSNKGLTDAYNNKGVSYALQGDYSQALECYRKALEIDVESKDRNGSAKRLCNMAIVFDEQGDYPKALDYNFKALKIAEELGNKQLQATILGNTGIVYDNQADYPKALDYYFNALKMDEKMNIKDGVVRHLCNIGIIYKTKADYTKALDCYFRALKMAEELGNKNSISTILGNIATAYDSQANYSKAEEYYFMAMKMAKEIGDKFGTSILLNNLGSLKTTQKKYNEAYKYLYPALALADSIGVKSEVKNSYSYLSELYEKSNIPLPDSIGGKLLSMEQMRLRSLYYYKRSVAIQDSLFSQENKKQLVRKEMNYEFDKKEATTKAGYDKQILLAEAEKKKQKIMIWSVISGFLLVTLFASLIFRSLRLTHKQKNIIELQKNEVLRQKEIVEEQKEKIIDSITYAQLIQQSILMEESEIQNHFPESFIYYQPKDIVSGDFYWFSKIDDKIIIAAIDCTGHGVPGAFMSMIGNTLLNQIVNEKRITMPSEILRLLNLGVYEALHQDKDGALSLDGMDIALCSIDYKNNLLQYAGVQNPLYVISGNQLEVFKADFNEIGGGGRITKILSPGNKEYANHVIPIKKDMSIYLFSDGYMDQFGGGNRKKFGIQKFKDILLNNQQLSMQKQKEMLASAHEEWKGNITQIDDILVIGLRI